MLASVSVAKDAKGDQIGRIVVQLVSIQMMRMKQILALLQINPASFTLVVRSLARLSRDKILIICIPGANGRGGISLLSFQVGQ